MKHLSRSLTTLSICASALTLGVVACDRPTPAKPVTTTSAPVNGAASEGALTDAQIVGIASAVDHAEVDAGKLALMHAQNAQVKQFADHMVSMHTTMEDKLMSLSQQQGIGLAQSDVEGKLKADNSSEGQKLSTMNGASFDQEYITAQVKGHQDVLDLLNNKLIPNAQSSKLKDALEDTRTQVVEHLRMAKEAKSALAT